MKTAEHVKFHMKSFVIHKQNFRTNPPIQVSRREQKNAKNNQIEQEKFKAIQGRNVPQKVCATNIQLVVQVMTDKLGKSDFNCISLKFASPCTDKAPYKTVAAICCHGSYLILILCNVCIFKRFYVQVCFPS